MSSVVPTSRFSRLSLKSMAPTTRSQSQRDTPLGSPDPRHNLDYDLASDSEISDASMDHHDGDDDDEDTRTIVCSPTTRIRYDISDLDPDTQSEVRQLFQDTPSSEPPQLVLQWCQFNQEPHDGQFYAFQLTEIVPRSVRIGSSSSRYAHPRCNCMGNSEKPCKHLIYLLDQLNYLSSDSLLDEPVQKIGPPGYSTDMRQPFEKISNFHLDLLASNLHCDVGSPESNTGINPVRLEETREILAAVSESDGDDYAVKDYCPDLFENQNALLKENGIITYNDLTSTVAKMLITNNDFFAYFLKLLGPASKARDPFHRIQHHVDRVLSELDAYSRNPSAPASTTEGPRNIPWAAAHITRAVSTIQYLLQNRTDPPSPAERASAARTLVRILHAVVFEWNRDIPYTPPPPPLPPPLGLTSNTDKNNRRGSLGSPPSLPPISPATTNQKHSHNLYQHLIGTQTHTTTAFILDTLVQLPEQNQWIETLEEIETRLLGGTYRPPAGYMRRLRDLILLMRSSSSSSSSRGAASATWMKPAAGTGTRRRDSSGVGSKRSSGGHSGREEGVKRAK